MENGFQGKEGQQIPEMTDEVINRISERYIELYEQVTGSKFEKQPVSESETEAKLKAAIAQLPQA